MRLINTESTAIDILCLLRFLLDIVKDVRPSYLDPLLNDIPDILFLDILLDYNVMRTNLLDCIVNDNVLILFLVLLLHVLRLHIIQVSALHAHRYELLILRVVTSPACPREWQTCHNNSVAPSQIIEWNLLDYLESEDGFASHALFCKFPRHNVANHLLETHILLCEIDPQFSDLLDVIVGDLEWYMPVVDREVRNRVVRDLTSYVLVLFVRKIIGHYTKIILDMLKMHLHFLVDLA
jgi:hypothetical protein